MYDSSTGVYGDVFVSGIVGRATDRLQESDVFDAVTASKWKLVATTGLHAAHIHICEVQFCGVEEGDPPRDLGEEGPNCQWEEYQQTKEYLDKVQWLSLLLMNLFIFYIVD